MLDKMLVRAGIGASIFGVLASIGAMVGLYNQEPSWLIVLLVSIGALSIASDAYLSEYQRTSEE